MRAFKTVMAIICGTTAFFFLVMSSQGGETGFAVGMAFFAVFALLTFLFGRKTKADAPRIEKQKQRQAAFEEFALDAAQGREPKQPDPAKTAERIAAAGTAAHAAAMPALVLKDLMKMQK